MQSHDVELVSAQRLNPTPIRSTVEELRVGATNLSSSQCAIDVLLRLHCQRCQHHLPYLRVPQKTLASPSLRCEGGAEQTSLGSPDRSLPLVPFIHSGQSAR